MATNFDVSSMLGKLSASQMAANKRKLREHGLLPDSESVAETAPSQEVVGEVQQEQHAPVVQASEQVSEAPAQVQDANRDESVDEAVVEDSSQSVEEESVSVAAVSDSAGDETEESDSEPGVVDSEYGSESVVDLDADSDEDEGEEEDDVESEESDDEPDDGGEEEPSESEDDEEDAEPDPVAQAVERKPLSVGGMEDAGDEPIIEVTPDGTEISRGGVSSESVEIIRDRSLEGSESHRVKPASEPVAPSVVPKVRPKGTTKRATKRAKKESKGNETTYARGIPLSTMSEMRKIFPGNYATGDVIAAYVAYKSGNSHGLTARQRAILDQVQDSDPYQDIQATMRSLKRMMQEVRDRCDVFEMALAYMMLDRMGAITDRPRDVTKAMLRMTPMEGFVEHLREEASIFQQALRMKEGRPTR